MRLDRPGGREIAGTDLAESTSTGGGWLARRPTLNLVVNLTLREVRSQYKRTTLGRLWSLLNPLATIAIFSIIFGLLFRMQPHTGEHSGIQAYALWVACGLIPWTFISGGIQAAMASLTSNAGLLTKVWFPRHVLVTSSVMSLVATFSIELLVLLVIMLVASVVAIGVGGLVVLAYLPVLLLVVALTAAFVLGIGLVLSVAVVYFRDIQHLWGIVTQAWFYASGVVFTFDLVEQADASLAESGVSVFGAPIPLVEIFRLNPAYHFLEAYRAVLYDFTFPDLTTWLVMIGWSAAVLVIGALVFRRFQGRIVEEL